MESAELTVGGFYAHFASQEALLSEVLARSLEQTRTVLLAGLDDVRGFPFIREVARRYLSRAHRDVAADGCALPALAGEVARQSGDTRAEFETFLEKLVASFAEHLDDDDDAGLTSRDRAIALGALFVGGLTFARAVKSPELSDRILLACKRFAALGEKK
jgi:TetR/AcrR family transcriptional repressor of nem operon